MYSCTLNKTMTSDDLSLPMPGYTISIFKTVGEIALEWNEQAGENLFIKSAFLTALEETPPSRTSYRYVLVRKEDEIVGIVYFQIKKIDLYRSLRLDAQSPEGVWNKFLHVVKSLLAKPLKANLLVLGNMTLTGSNGYVFKENIDKEEAFRIAKTVTEEVVCRLKKERTRIAAVLIKDYYEDQKFVDQSLGYTEFKVQPNMIMQVSEEWKSFEDYMNNMKSKYRVRVRRARKKLGNLEKRLLSIEEIHAYSEEISALYKNVAEQAGFNLFILPVNYFYSLQKHLKDRMEMFGYFEGDRMVGFYTNILSHDDLDAHFLGYDPKCNRECQLYLNMLYDLVDDCIRLGGKRLILSRTALEIKSSIGAEPHAMVLYLKTTNRLLNLGVAKALNYFKPTQQWVPRSPFK